MDIFEAMAGADYEQVVFCRDEASGLKAIIAIHDTTLGPALGGCRMWNYPSEEEALVDVLRLAKGMTYKSAAAGLNLGGGKAVIIGDPASDKSEALLRAFGRFVQGLNGRYITAEDVGTTVADMDTIQMETDFVAGTSSEHGSSGAPSPYTALGVFHGIRAAAQERFGSPDLSGRTVAVQGIGSVGYALCGLLHEAGAKLIVSDIRDDALMRAHEQFGASVAASSAVYDADCDVFAPCAFGAILNDETIPRLRCAVVAGSANNQLKEPRHGDMLESRGILYAPDYVVNAGGVINISVELEGYSAARARHKVEQIYPILLRLFDIARKENIPTYAAADRLAEQRISAIRRSTGFYVGSERRPRNKS